MEGISTGSTRKEESLAFAEVAVPKGYQVLGVDLPVERKPWEL